VSYSVYLLHFVVIYIITVKGWYLDFATGPVVDALLTTLLIATPATLLLSALSYHVIERPFLALRSSYYR
jgi:peptidoglycan/LPS O-acetylase OafA/YrhL